ncbi:MAG: hypothetical protein AB1505_01810 [Candidatus Latescibacterota bacterium]
MRLREALANVQLPALHVGTAMALSWSDFRARLHRLEEVQAVLARTEIPAQHPFWGSGARAYDPDRAERVRRKSQRALHALNTLTDSVALLGRTLGLPAAGDSQTASMQLAWARRILDGPAIAGIVVNDTGWIDEQDTLKRGPWPAGPPAGGLPFPVFRAHRALAADRCPGCWDGEHPSTDGQCPA